MAMKLGFRSSSVGQWQHDRVESNLPFFKIFLWSRGGMAGSNRVPYGDEARQFYLTLGQWAGGGMV